MNLAIRQRLLDHGQRQGCDLVQDGDGIGQLVRPRHIGEDFVVPETGKHLCRASGKRKSPGLEDLVPIVSLQVVSILPKSDAHHDAPAEGVNSTLPNFSDQIVDDLEQVWINAGLGSVGLLR
jgi:hypothetical protein